jgi:pyrroline-5-carboxylate reductase
VTTGVEADPAEPRSEVAVEADPAGPEVAAGVDLAEVDPAEVAVEVGTLAAMTLQLAIIGGGRMGEALGEGLLASGWARPDAVAIVEALPARRAELTGGVATRHPGVQITAELSEGIEGAVIAVKPADVEGACRTLRAHGVRRVLSIAAGVPLARLERWVAAPGTGSGATPGGRSGSSAPAGGGADAPIAVLRAMPNTAALVGAGAAAVAAGTAAGADDVAWASGILAAVGTVVAVPEYLLDAVTGLSGSGPAYVFLVAEALIDAGVFVGLPRATAKDLVVQTILGAARLLEETGEAPEALRAAVTSPAGTTAAGVRALEVAGVRAGLMDAVSAATERSRELGAG